MGLLPRKKRYIFYLILVGFLLFLGYAAYRVFPYFENQWTDEQLTTAFAESIRPDVSLGYVKGTTRRLRYLQIGEDSTKPFLVFIHGSPSSSAFWVEMMQDSSLRSRANLLAIDRPGYGGSGLGQAMISVEEQAKSVMEVIRDRIHSDSQSVILHGSSYGGTVSARIAMDYPELIDGLMLQSASTAPKEEYVYWLSEPTTHWSLRWLLPRSIRTANREKLNHLAQLEDMADSWAEIDASTVIVHGTNDWLIYPRNAYYSCNKLINAPVVIHHMVEDGEHDLIYRTPDLLKRYLHRLLDRVTGEVALE